MKTEQAKGLIESLEEDRDIQQLIAQAKSRYILYNVNEPEENFPDYTKRLTEKNNHSAYSYLNAGCYIAEEGNLSDSLIGLRKGASILEYNFKSSRDTSEYSDYYLLTLALAYYASFEYSKAFVSISKIKYELKTAQLFRLFLSKEYVGLDKLISSIQIDQEYQPDRISTSIEDGSSKINIKVYEYLLSLSMSRLLLFFYNGEDSMLQDAIEIATDTLELLSEDREPSLWWCLRLYRIILMGFYNSAIWKILPPNFPDHEEATFSFIQNLARRKPIPIVEFFISQREAIAKAAETSGLVVSLPTSSGKTRIAEVSIFQTLLNPDSIVLYIAPFRSLAYEVEDTLEITFEKIGFPVSHLYGGASFSKIDRLEIENARIIVATPEKAKALFRAADDLVDKVKLVVLDEGHLLGDEERFIRNEMFFEELRFHMEKNEGKFLILSAVLPNSHHMSKWLTNSEKNIHENKWSPSSKRIGTLEFKGNNVNINWKKEDPETWNNSFIVPIQQGEKIFPSNLKDAIASTAVKLCHNGSVLIFQAKSNRVVSQGRACIEAFGEEASNHTWTNALAWHSFELAVKNSLGLDHDIYKLAQCGIICHFSKLPRNVKASFENLMRTSNPRIIIATTTLAQGVNLGVSTVIIADVWFGAPGNSVKISNSKFWNIVGRAGRAFVDSEGKVLYAIDKNTNRRIIRAQEATANSYLEEEFHDEVNSGVYLLLKFYFDLAKKAKIDFEYLIQLISENSPVLSELDIEQDNLNYVTESFDLLDDTLLSLSYKFQSFNDNEVSGWIDTFFRRSLFYIQAEENEALDEVSLLSYLKKRNVLVTEKAGIPENWLSHIKTGIPVRASLKLDSLLDDFESYYKDYLETDKTFEDLSDLVQLLEDLVDQLPGETFKKKTLFRNIELSEDRNTAIHNMWLSGESYLDITNATTGEITNHFCSSYFGYTLPWVFNAVSRKFKVLEKEDCSEFYENLATMIELGLPDVVAVKNYIGGIKSRLIATEIRNVIEVPTDNLTISDHIDFLLSVKEGFNDQLSDDAKTWLSIIESRQKEKIKEEVQFPNFTLDTLIKDKTYSVKIFNGNCYLCSSDYISKVSVESTEQFPFEKIGHKLSYFFRHDDVNEFWEFCH